MKKILTVISIVLLFLAIPMCASGKEEENTVVISFAGDCTLGGFKGQTAGNQFSDYYAANNAAYFFKNVKDIFENDDITFVNLEGALTSHQQVVQKKFPIKGEPEYIDVLLAGSIEAVGLSNNHTYDCWQAGYDECKEIISDAAIKYCGDAEVCTITKNGVKIGMASVSCWSNSEAEKKVVKTAIDSLKESNCDVICVMFHGGIEREYQSNSVTEGFAHYAVDQGADIVIGAHPHVLQGIEEYNGKIIAYSLGNFCFGANKNPSDKDCFILQQEFVIKSNNATYGKTNVIPCKISSTDITNDYCPTVQTGSEADRILEKIEKNSRKYEVMPNIR